MTESCGQIPSQHSSGPRGGVVSPTAHGAVPVANECVSHHQRNVVRIGPATTLHSCGHMSQWHSVVTNTDIRPSVSAVHIDGDLVRTVNSNLGKMCLSQLTERVVVNTTSSCQHHAGSLVVCVDVVSKVVPGDALDPM